MSLNQIKDFLNHICKRHVTARKNIRILACHIFGQSLRERRLLSLDRDKYKDAEEGRSVPVRTGAAEVPYISLVVLKYFVQSVQCLTKNCKVLASWKFADTIPDFFHKY